MPDVPMLEQFEKAAIDCQSVTLLEASSRVNQIKRIAHEAAGQFRRIATIELDGQDVVVTFVQSAV
jgi:hypothetical protein